MRLRPHVRNTRLARLIRGLRLDRNPLRRGSDRAGTVIGAALLAAVAAATPFAAHAAAGWMHASSLRDLQAQRTSFRHVRAVLLDKPVTVQAWDTAFAQADCRWTAPDGHVVTELVVVPAGATAGSTVLVWTNHSGQLVTPLQPAQIQSRDRMAAGAAVTVVLVTAGLAGLAVRRGLNRRRMAAWEADWLATGPRWTSRR